MLLAKIRHLNHDDLNRNIIKLSSYQGGEDGSSIDADERGRRFVVLLLSLPHTGETLLHKLFVVLHPLASGHGKLGSRIC